MREKKATFDRSVYKKTQSFRCIYNFKQYGDTVKFMPINLDRDID